MEIEWEEHPKVMLPKTMANFAFIPRPPVNIRFNKRNTNGRVAVAAYDIQKDGTYHVSFLHAINEYFKPPTANLHTEKGARRRIRKYIELWVIAGYPLGD